MKVMDVNAIQYDCEINKTINRGIIKKYLIKKYFIFNGNVNLRWEVTFQPWEVVHKENTET